MPLEWHYNYTTLVMMLVYYSQVKPVTKTKPFLTPPLGTTCLQLLIYDDKQLK